MCRIPRFSRNWRRPMVSLEARDPVDAAVLEVNRAFYEAFETSTSTQCLIFGYGDHTSVRSAGGLRAQVGVHLLPSWAAMFDSPQNIQFIVTDEHVSGKW